MSIDHQAGRLPKPRVLADMIGGSMHGQAQCGGMNGSATRRTDDVVEISLRGRPRPRRSVTPGASATFREPGFQDASLVAAGSQAGITCVAGVVAATVTGAGAAGVVIGCFA
jgi:hypothetical protein